MSETLLAPLSGQKGPKRFDELRDEDGLIRPHWRGFAKTLTGLSPEEFARRRASAGAMVRDNGVTYNVYDETAGQTRPWQLDIVPFILSASDWRNIEAAVVQRAAKGKNKLAEEESQQLAMQQAQMQVHVQGQKQEHADTSCLTKLVGCLVCIDCFRCCCCC